MKLKSVAFALIVGLAVPSAFAQDQYLVRVPANVNLSAAAPEAPAEPIVLSLSSEAPPVGRLGQPYTFNLLDRLSITGGTGSHNYSDTTWSLKAGDALPAGLSLSGNIISGTPTLKQTEGTSFEVAASYKGENGQQVYTIVVYGQPLKATQIALGDKHSCAVTLTGGVKCWGYNADGQLGNNTTTNSLVPVDVTGLSNAVGVTVGADHSCAITSEGAAFCWGRGGSGQLGTGFNSNERKPRAVSGLNSGVSRISAGNVHTCAITASGHARCWGNNGFSQLGLSVTANFNTPIAQDWAGVGQTERPVKSISAGGPGSNFTCIVNVEGAVYCWGDNQAKQSGNSNWNTTTKVARPVYVDNATFGMASVSIGTGHACALTSAGAVKCWGAGSYWIQDVSGLSSGVSSISSGGYHSCAMTNDGTAKCWGLNSSGQMGDGTTTNQGTRTTGPAVEIEVNQEGVSGIFPGYNGTCATLKSGEAKCWGANQYGQLGDGTTTSRLTPVAVELP